MAGLNKVQEYEVPLSGNDKENWGNHHVGAIEVWKGYGKASFSFWNLLPDEEISLSTLGCGQRTAAAV